MSENLLNELLNSQTVAMNINKIIPYDKNPRKISEDAVYNTAQSIKTFGWKKPIEVDENLVILAGHTRLLAAKFLGLEEVPVVVHKDLEEYKKKAYRIADNRTAEFTTWDFVVLKDEYEDIKLSDDDMTYTGFDDSFFSEGSTEEEDTELSKQFDSIKEDSSPMKVKITVEVVKEEEDIAKNEIKKLLNTILVNDYIVS